MKGDADRNFTRFESNLPFCPSKKTYFHLKTKIGQILDNRNKRSKA